MRHIIETGTDAAMVCFFDPAALPGDYNRREELEALEYVEELAKAGRIWFQNTGGDGGYLFHFYIEEDIPEAISRFCHDPKEINRLLVPGGTILACGLEYASRQAELRKYSHMGGRFDLEAGEYRTTAWRTEWPEGAMESELEKRLGKSRVRNETRSGCLTGIMLFVAPILTIGALFYSYDFFVRGGVNRLAVIWTAASLAWAVFALLIRVVLRAQKNPVRKEVEHEFPNIIVQMKRLG